MEFSLRAPMSSAMPTVATVLGGQEAEEPPPPPPPPTHGEEAASEEATACGLLHRAAEPYIVGAGCSGLARRLKATMALLNKLSPNSFDRLSARVLQARP